MLQGLVIRRVFLALDFVLVVLVIGVAGLAVRSVLKEPVSVYAELTGGTQASGPLTSIRLDVAKRGDYDAIVSGGLFGPLGNTVAAAVAAGPVVPTIPVDPPIVETKLNLALRGTVSTSAQDPLASATIENKDTREVRVYGLNYEIMENVLLKEVHQRKVVISNRGTDEVLRMDEEDPTLLAAAQDSSPGGALSSNSGDRFEIDQNEFVRELYVNYNDLITKVQPEMVTDDDGNVTGITASNIEEIPLAQTLDLKDGDVLQSINNEPIDSQQAIIRIINKNRDSKTFRIGIMRDGKPMVRTYQMK